MKLSAIKTACLCLIACCFSVAVQAQMAWASTESLYPTTTTASVKVIPGPFTFVHKISEPLPLNYAKVRSHITYPEAAAAAGVQGVVYLRILVDQHGQYVRHLVMTEVHPLLVCAVEQEVAHLKFKPGQKGTQPVAAWITLPFAFRMPT
ncbi:MAG: energy transducer TonB [Bacteroidota bacterium]